MIYFLRGKTSGTIKIGTTVRLSQRIAGLTTEVKEAFEVLGICKGSFEEENALHRKFCKFRTRGREWFSPDPSIFAYVAENCLPWDGADEVPLGYLVSPVVSLELKQAIESVARKDHRKVGPMIVILLREALAARGQLRHGVKTHCPE